VGNLDLDTKIMRVQNHVKQEILETSPKYTHYEGDGLQEEIWRKQLMSGPKVERTESGQRSISDKLSRYNWR
jgi:hypothetical protein